MPTRLFHCGLALLVLALGCQWGDPLGPAPEGMRTWVVRNGSERYHAKLVEVRAVDVVLELPSGERRAEYLYLLSYEDRLFIENAAQPPARESSSTPTPVASAPAAPVVPWTPQELPRGGSELREILAVEAPTPLQEFPAPAGHKEPVQAIALSADGRRMASCSATGDCRVWDVESGRELARLDERLPGERRLAALTPDGAFALFAGEGGVRTLEVATARMIHLHKSERGISHLRSSDDGKWTLYYEPPGSMHRYPLGGGTGGNLELVRDDKPFDLAAWNHAGDLCAVARTGTYEALLAPWPADAGPAAEREQPRPAVTAETLERIRDLTMGRGHMALVSIAERVYFAPQSAWVGAKRSKWSSVWHQGHRLTNVALPASDDRLLYLVPRLHRVAAHSLEFPEVSRQWPLPQQEVACAHVGDDGRTIVVGRTDGSIAAWRLPAWNGGDVALARRLGQLRRERDFAGLDQLFDQLDSLDMPAPWSANINPIDFAQLHLFSTTSTTPWKFAQRSQFISEWRTQLPNSPWGVLAAANLLLDEAVQARGAGFANTVSPEGARVFHEKTKEAWLLAEPLWSLGKPPSPAYTVVLRVAMSENWSPERVERYVTQLLADHPQAVLAHQTNCRRLLPKWGGLPGAMASYVDRVCRRFPGPEGDAMYARLAFAMMLEWQQTGFLYDYDRIGRGLKHLQRRYPGDNWSPNAGLLLARWFNRKDDGRHHADALARHHDQGNEFVWTLDKGKLAAFTAALKWARAP